MTAEFRAGRTLTMLGVASALLSSGLAGSGPASALDCEALKTTPVPYELTIRAENRTVTRNGEAVVLPPRTEWLRVLRGEGGRVVTLLHRRDGDVPTRSHKLYYLTLDTTLPSGERTTFVQEGRPDHDPVARKEDFTEIHTVEEPGRPPRRRRMEARFVGEDVAEIGPCRFTVHRYRAILYADPSPDGAPLSETTVDYAPELLIPVRHVATSPVVTQTRIATGITTDLSPLPEPASKPGEP
ncbi:hypothetical protein [uncultured Methylobacterium sp.]|jgi:hypothetical protein|uniref:hypothetical protein n=1 Tax=uncultured Methylobacterium sp. TaxID=157278 RepID=UPI0026086315|nr:hypothetical protein [uncultured Methylobacterium sp.]